METNEIVNEFGKTFIENVRSEALWQLESIIAGTMKSENAIKLHNKICAFSSEERAILKEIATDAIDRALFKVMFMFETSEDFIIGAVQEDEIFDLKDLSDGLSGEYYQWVEDYEE